jgi:1-acyl-sn-glycerol-3-phosphate acyltransferase
MSPGLRVAVALPRVVLHIALGFAIIAFAFPLISRARQHRLVRWWSRRVLAICGVRVRVIGPRPEANKDVGAAMRPDGIGAMLVMNHISWIDIHVVHSLRPARFVARAEIARWPVIGYLTGRTGTIFIERGRRHAVREVNHRVAQYLRDGDLVTLFPEGMTSDGDRLLPFHANLVQPAIEARVPIVVAGLRYLDARGRPTTAPSYAGEINLFESIVRIVHAGPITAELHLIEAIDSARASGSVTRHEIAQRARALVADALGFDDENDEVEEEISTVIVVPDEAHLSRGVALPGTGPETAIDPRDELL